MIVRVVVCSHSLVSLRPFPAAQPEPPQKFVPAQESKRSQSEQRKNEEEEDEQAVPDRRVLICRGQTESAPGGPQVCLSAAGDLPFHVGPLSTLPP